MKKYRFKVIYYDISQMECVKQFTGEIYSLCKISIVDYNSGELFVTFEIEFKDFVNDENIFKKYSKHKVDSYERDFKIDYKDFLLVLFEQHWLGLYK